MPTVTSKQDETIIPVEPLPDDTVDKNIDDVEKLTKLIKELNSNGANVPESLDDSAYTWNKEGQLTDIEWEECNLTGSLVMPIFMNLQYLDCTNNKLSVLDVSSCLSLTALSCFSNGMNNLNVRNCVMLTNLYCHKNKLSSLFLEDCILLKDLSCADNQLSELDISSNNLLKWLECSNNQIKILDMSSCVNLYELDCDETVEIIGYYD